MFLSLATITEYLLNKSFLRLIFLDFQSVTIISFDFNIGINGKISYEERPSSTTKSKPPLITKQ